jgi:flagellar assembly protein FliH
MKSNAGDGQPSAARRTASAEQPIDVPVESASVPQEQEPPVSCQQPKTSSACTSEAHAAGHAGLCRRLCRRHGGGKAAGGGKAIAALMDNLQQALAAIDQGVADQLLALAIEIANQVLRQSLRVQPELLLPVVREAVTTLHPHHGQPLLFVHPDDAAWYAAS